jgi:hypothetical protein
MRAFPTMNLDIKRRVAHLFVLLAILSFCGRGQLAGQTIPKTKIVLLGTGAPAPDPDHSGPATRQ